MAAVGNGRGSRVFATLAAVMAVGALLAACGGGGSGGNALTGAGRTTTTAGGGALTGTTGSIPDGSTASGKKGGKVRILNVFNRGGKPGPTLDIYETALPGTGDEPVIAGLAYGELSDYVQPRSDYGSGNLYLFPAGSKVPHSKGGEDFAGQSVSNAGFDPGTQQTVVIGSDKSFDDPTKDAPIYTSIFEVGTTDLPVPDTWKAIDGKGLVLVNASGLGRNDQRELSAYVALDGTCPKRLDPENSVGGGADAPEEIANGNAVPFEVAPGAHTVGILTSPYNDVLSTCDATTAAKEAKFSVAAGGRVEVFAFAPTPTADAVTVLTAPVPG